MPGSCQTNQKIPDCICSPEFFAEICREETGPAAHTVCDMTNAEVDP